MSTPEERAIVERIAKLKAQVRTLEDALAILRDEEAPSATRRRRRSRTDRIVEALSAAPGGLTRTELAEALGEDPEDLDLLSNALSHLKSGGRVSRAADGRWTAPPS